MAWPTVTHAPTINSDAGKVKYPTVVLRYDEGVGQTFASGAASNDYDHRHPRVRKAYNTVSGQHFVPVPADIGGGGAPVAPPTEGQLWPRGDHTQPD